MAGASMNDIKARMKSVSGTMQITKAMELVATSKLRKARERVESARSYCDVLSASIGTVLSSGDFSESAYRRGGASRTLFVVIAGDRGLAGGYNANVFRLARSLAEGKDACYLPIGKKAQDHYRHRSLDVIGGDVPLAAQIGVGGAMTLGRLICDGYLAGQYGSVVLVYTRFVSMISVQPVYEELLPLSSAYEGGGSCAQIEGDGAELLDLLIPDYVGGILYSAVSEALASESGARRMAMNSASKNAEEMMDQLSLKFNRARQAQITQEITEIVSGAEAL